MADAIRKRTGIESTLVPGHGGAFEVTVDGRRIFSKLSERRFPGEQEILAALEKNQS